MDQIGERDFALLLEGIEHCCGISLRKSLRMEWKEKGRTFKL